MKRKKEILIHFIVWLLYIANNIISYPNEYLQKYGYFNIGLKQVTGISVYIIIFYINYFYIVPSLLGRKRYAKYSMAMFLLFTLYTGLMLGHSKFLDWYFQSGSFFWNDRISDIWYFYTQCVFYVFVSTGARIISDWLKTQKISEELEKEKTKSELSLLKYQVSPHFLFNTMNNIYSLIYQDSGKAAESVLKLSEIMRYMLKENINDLVYLKSEIDYLKNFIELQKLRLNNPELISFNFDGRADGEMISPMILVPFVENAFKHGDTFSDKAFIDIELSVHDKMLSFNVKNITNKSRKDSTRGIGIANVKRRLEILYPGRHELEISNDNEFFNIKLKLDLK